MNELMVSFQRWVGSDAMILIFLVGGKTVAGSYIRVTMGDLLVWGQKLDPNLHQDTFGEPTSRAIDWCNNNVVVTL